MGLNFVRPAKEEKHAQNNYPSCSTAAAASLAEAAASLAAAAASLAAVQSLLRQQHSVKGGSIVVTAAADQPIN